MPKRRKIIEIRKREKMENKNGLGPRQKIGMYNTASKNVGIKVVEKNLLR